ncbi:MAG: GTP cyclohydrolase FolE2 [Spirochaetaceae bacterium]|jgi:GTP cyclohydrolase I|nr:GTP cyclohydrolase FolE2 [Spirochaetaceae bacterium]
MIDIQRVKEDRGIKLEKVGIKRLRYPVRLLVKGGAAPQTPVATIELAVEVPSDVKATHMSRFTRLVHRYKDALHSQRFIEMIQDVRTQLEAPRAYGKFSFPYYLEKNAPISREISLMEYQCELEGTSGESGDELFLTVMVPVTTLCPCSKAISEMGAHNQRADVKVIADISKELLWIEDIIKAVEDSASSPLYSLLKREDEKYVTEQAYKNPQFVEDVVREAYLRIEKLYRNKQHCSFVIECESYESIHNHSAFASTQYQYHTNS